MRCRGMVRVVPRTASYHVSSKASTSKLRRRFGHFSPERTVVSRSRLSVLADTFRSGRRIQVAEMEKRQTDGTGTGVTGRPALGALLVMQIVLGYEWFSSGLTKVVHGDFPGGLGHELTEKSVHVSGWYSSFLHGAVIPHAEVFGYLIEVGELVTGLAFFGSALVGLVWERLPRGARPVVLLTTAAAAFAGVVMNVNFHLANGSSLPWPVAADSFDEAVDLDNLMAALQLVLVAASAQALISLRRADRRAPHQRTERRQRPPSGREMFTVNTHIDRKLSLDKRPVLWLLATLVAGLALGAVLFGGRGSVANAAPAQTRGLTALEAKLGQAQQDARFWTQLTTVLKPAPAHLRSMQDHRLYMLPSGIVLGLHFDNMNLAKAKNLNWIVFGVPGVFTKADQQRVTQQFGPGFVHFHDFANDVHGGKPGARGFWFVHIGARNFTSMLGAKVKAGVIDPLMMPTPPRS